MIKVISDKIVSIKPQFRWLAFGLIPPAVLIGPALFFGEMFYFMDFSNFFYPSYLLNSLSYRGGEIPLWSPFNLCGTPHAAAWYNGSFYPLSILFIIAPFRTGLVLFIIAHYLIAFGAAYMASAIWLKSPAARAVVGLTYSCCGYMISAIDSVNILCSAAYIPAILCFWWYFLENAKWPLFLSTIATCVLQILAGGPEAVLCTWLMLGIITCGQIAETPVNWKKLCVYYSGAAICTIFLSGVQTIPFFELYLDSSRAARLEMEISENWSLKPYAILRLIAPDFATFPDRDGIRYDGIQYWLKSYYIGAVAVLLSCVTIGRLSAKEKSLWLLTLAGMILAIGPNFPTGNLIAKIPVINGIRYPVKFILITVVSLTLLGAKGLSLWIADRNTRKHLKYLLIVLGSVALPVAAIAHFYGDSLGQFLLEGTNVANRDQDHYFRTELAASVRNSCIVVVIEISVFLLLVRLHDRLGARLTPTSRNRLYGLYILLFISPLLNNAIKIILTKDGRLYPEIKQLSPSPDRIAVSKPQSDRIFSFERYYDLVPAVYNQIPIANANIMYGRSSIDGFYPITLKDIYRINLLLNSRVYVQEDWPEHPFLKYLAVNTAFLISSPDHHWQHTNENPLAFSRVDAVSAPRARLFVHTREIRKNDDPYNHLFSAHYKPAREFYLDARNSWLGGESINVDLIDESLNEIVYAYYSETEGYLVTSDSYHKGWRVSLADGTVLTTQKVNGGFRGVKVPAGTHTVVFRYRPKSFLLGVASTLTTGIALLAFCLISRRSHHPER